MFFYLTVQVDVEATGIHGQHVDISYSSLELTPRQTQPLVHTCRTRADRRRRRGPGGTRLPASSGQTCRASWWTHIDECPALCPFATVATPTGNGEQSSLTCRRMKKPQRSRRRGPDPSPTGHLSVWVGNTSDVGVSWAARSHGGRWAVRPAGPAEKPRPGP